MAWNKNDYPESMKNLDESVRNKAIEIATASLKNTMRKDAPYPLQSLRRKSGMKTEEKKPRPISRTIWCQKKTSGL